MENKITEIIRINGTGYKILNHLFKSSNLKKNYMAKIRKEENFTYGGGFENLKKLIELELVTAEKVGKKRYLIITEKGKKVIGELYNIQGRLEEK